MLWVYHVVSCTRRTVYSAAFNASVWAAWDMITASCVCLTEELLCWINSVYCRTRCRRSRTRLTDQTKASQTGWQPEWENLSQTWPAGAGGEEHLLSIPLLKKQLWKVSEQSTASLTTAKNEVLVFKYKHLTILKGRVHTKMKILSLFTR